MAQTSAGSPESREIRVFLSSTFRDFMEERDLLVRQVFPELRRKARERGVDIVDVDLRWGITQEQSEQGKVIPICLSEIDRCRPYFIGMLGERYGWIPPADQYSLDVIERQPWLKQHLGGVSVTELEILHGVLNDLAMAGRAFFYFRDPAWSTGQLETGFVCETPEEETKLADLKQRIRTSGFPIADNLPDPKALTDQIGHDLWDLIEQQYPDLDAADALEREERQHASYRRSRLGVYVGGTTTINKLESWINTGQQSILITGESGAGKSALIANWIEAHQHNHPDDVVFAHHLGCSNDASAIRPLLARLIETAKQQLPEVYGYSLSVPQEWWDLVAKVVEALQSLGRWAQQNNLRWIWVLDGLDRLAQDDQNALPWLPLTIPEGVVIMASSLECSAREILLERKFNTHTIAPLMAKEQDALIQQYLGRYTKQLIAELRQTIICHPLSGSPLFLNVLLEELRQCGRYETIAVQLDSYLGAETIDDLYARMLKRLEAHGNAENVRKAMTALWASRAGLSEEEILSISELAPLHWAPIYLALEQALRRNGNRIVIDHSYLLKAVMHRYAPTIDKRINAHAKLADWFESQSYSNSRRAEEWPWQLLECRRIHKLKEAIFTPSILMDLAISAPLAEVAQWCRAAIQEENEEFNGVVLKYTSDLLLRMDLSAEQKLNAVRLAGDILEQLGNYGKALIGIRRNAVKLARHHQILKQNSSIDLARSNLLGGRLDDAIKQYKECIEMVGWHNQDPQERTSEILGGIANALLIKNELSWMSGFYPLKSLELEIDLSGCALSTRGFVNLCEQVFLQDGTNYDLEESLYKAILHCYKYTACAVGDASPRPISLLVFMMYIRRGKELANPCKLASRALDRAIYLLGEANILTLAIRCWRYCWIIARDYSKEAVRSCAEYVSRIQESTDGMSSYYIIALGNLGVALSNSGRYEESAGYLQESYTKASAVLGRNHPFTIQVTFHLCKCYKEFGIYDQAFMLAKQFIASAEPALGRCSPIVARIYSDIANTAREMAHNDIAFLYSLKEVRYLRRMLDNEEAGYMCRQNYPESLWTLGEHYKRLSRLEKAEYYFTLAISESHFDTKTAFMKGLICFYLDTGAQGKARECYVCLSQELESIFGKDHVYAQELLDDIQYLSE